MARVSKAERRDAILEAALLCFAEHGYEAARVEDIARRAGIAKGSVYLYFADKEALFQGLLADTLTLLQSRVEKVLARRDLTLRQKIRLAARPLLEENGNGRIARVLRLYWAEGLHNPELSEVFYREFIGGLFSVGAAGLLAEAGDKVPATLKAHPELLFSGLVQGLLWQGLLGTSRPMDLTAHWEAYLDTVLGPAGPEDELHSEEDVC